MDNNTIENNKLIAEFMQISFNVNGFEIIFEHPLYIKLLTVNNRFWDERDSNFSLNPYTLLEFHTSWDWLMTVVEKIEDLSFNGRKVWTVIKTFNTSRDENYHEMEFRVYDANSSESKYLFEYDSEWYDTKIEAVYNAIVEFIKWFNQQSN